MSAETSSHRKLRIERVPAGRSVAVLALALTACWGGGATDLTVGTTTSAVPATTTSAVPATTTSAVPATTTSAVPTTAATVSTTGPTGTARAPSTTIGPGAACPSSPLPANVTSVTTAAGSFDGDGQPDVLKAYQAAGVWHLRTELSAGGEVDVTVPNVGAGDAVKALGGFNIDSGADEIFASVGSGGYATLVGIWNGGGFCQLTRLTVNGQPSTFPVGASVRNRSGLRCIGGTALQILDSQSTDGAQYTGTIANYDVVGSTLVQANTSPPQVHAAGDPGLVPYGALTCGTLRLS